MEYTYKTKGTCSSQISFEIRDGRVYNVKFLGGCNGNLKAVSKLAEGMSAEKLIELLSGNTCGFKKTSCADPKKIGTAGCFCYVRANSQGGFTCRPHFYVILSGA
jgi:uncharacterized protein (TIGR03905 family)